MILLLLIVFLLLLTIPSALALLLYIIGYSVPEKYSLNLNLQGTLATFAPLFKHENSSKRPVEETLFHGPLAILVPCHNEEDHLPKTLASLIVACIRFPAVIVVIADRCSDRTAEIARSHGIEVIERKSDGCIGKSYALEYAFDQLLKKPYKAFAVVDGDTTVSPNFTYALACAFGTGIEAIQVKYELVARENSNIEQLISFAFHCFNHLRGMARAHLGLSSGIYGNGFALRKEVLEMVPYTCHSLVEDLSYHLQLVKRKIQVHYLHEAQVYSCIPTKAEGQRIQRTRWEGGRIQVVQEEIPQLFSMICKGRWDLVEPLLELSTLPLSIYGILIIFSLWLLPFYALLSGVLLCIYLLCGLLERPKPLKDLQSMLSLPYFLVQKGVIWLRLLFSNKKTFLWTKTPRN